MAIMSEAMSKDDFERREMGLPPIKKIVVKRSDPPKPEIENEIRFADIPANDFSELESAKRKMVQNSEGNRFMGYEVTIILDHKRKAGRPKESEKDEIQTGPKTLSGWMAEGEFLTLVRTFRKQINPQVISW